MLILITVVQLFFPSVLIHALTDCSNIRIQPISELPTRYLPIDTNYYGKFVVANGFPILAPNKVTDRFLADAARSLKGLTDALQPEILRKLQAKPTNIRLQIYANKESICAIPEIHQGRPCTSGDHGVTSYGNTVFKEDWTDSGCGMGIMFHEFTHQINQEIGADVDQQLTTVYNNAKATGLFAGKYGNSNANEFFAEMVTTWFADGYNCVLGEAVCTKRKFQEICPQCVDFIKQIFPGHQWTNRCDDVCGPVLNSKTKTMHGFTTVDNKQVLAYRNPGIRLYNHYTQYKENSEISCWSQCVRQWSSGCRGSTFVAPEKSPFEYNCYLYKDDYTTRSDQDWSSFTSADSRHNAELGRGVHVHENKRLSRHYKLVATTSARMCYELCKRDDETNCVSTFVDKVKVPYWGLSENCCFFKRNDFVMSDEQGWTSYF